MRANRVRAYDLLYGDKGVRLNVVRLTVSPNAQPLQIRARHPNAAGLRYDWAADENTQSAWRSLQPVLNRQKPILYAVPFTQFGPGETLVPADGSLGRSLEGNRASFETGCGSWAGFKLGRYLMEFTGDCTYGDWIEKLVYNGIGAALPLQPDGSTFYYSDYTLAGGRKGYFPAKWPCCSGTYIQAIADYHNLIYFRRPHALLVNLFVPSMVTWNHVGNEVRLEQETTYPQTDTSLVTVRTRRPDTFKIQFRVPRWCRNAGAQLNGNSLKIDARPGTWASIDRRWNDGDRLKISLPMEHVVRPIDQQHPNRVAFVMAQWFWQGKAMGRWCGETAVSRSSSCEKAPSSSSIWRTFPSFPSTVLGMAIPIRCILTFRGKRKSGNV